MKIIRGVYSTYSIELNWCMVCGFNLHLPGYDERGKPGSQMMPGEPAVGIQYGGEGGIHWVIHRIGHHVASTRYITRVTADKEC